jgi:hypothetical protein
MAVQQGRSKDHVVRLEPFFTDAPVASLDRPVPNAPGKVQTTGIHGVQPLRPQAARAEGRVAAAVDSNRTLTRLETPDSSMVTP